MSVEIFAQRLKDRLAAEVKSNHAQMDKGVAHDEYMKLVGRNAQCAKTADIINEEVKKLGAEDDE